MSNLAPEYDSDLNGIIESAKVESTPDNLLRKTVQGVVFVDPGGLGIGSAGDFSAYSFATGTPFTDAADAGTVYNSLDADLVADGSEGIVVFGAGGFDVSTAIAPSDGMTLQGQGREATQLISKIGTDYAIKVQGSGTGVANHAQEITLRGFKLFQDTADGGGIFIEYSDNCFFHELWITDFDGSREAVREVESWEQRWTCSDIVGGSSTDGQYSHVITSSSGAQSNHLMFDQVKWGGGSGDLMLINDSHEVKFSNCKWSMTGANTCITIDDNPSNRTNSPRQFIFDGCEIMRDEGIQEGTGIQINSGQKLIVSATQFNDLVTAFAGFDANLRGRVTGCQFNGVGTVNDIDTTRLKIVNSGGYVGKETGTTTISNGSTTAGPISTTLSDGVIAATDGRVEAIEDPGAAKTFWISNFDENNDQFTISADADPGQDVTVRWEVWNVY